MDALIDDSHIHTLYAYLPRLTWPLLYNYRNVRFLRREVDFIPGEVVDITDVRSSEQPARNLYRRWAEFMQADSWDALMSWRRNDRAAAE